ncbi:hypothetical protein B4119_1454 [Parageobacillus caldoxylosilyticus]|uniref:Uncharacterized protein n=1 Tax=Saccharococcus caldoxylosilyticus TaxID=81408 RepID=A0A150LR18_9BACL|nr:hypothetical protein B4119_1454 [Parageobacillus caldoxylosilyticus]
MGGFFCAFYALMARFAARSYKAKMSFISVFVVFLYLVFHLFFTIPV